MVTLLAMFGHRLGGFDLALQSWIELVLATPVVLWAGWPFFVRGVRSIAQRSPRAPTGCGRHYDAAWTPHPRPRPPRLAMSRR